jgi:hypothetical protein
MPGIHDDEKYKLIGCWVDLDFLAAIDKARGEQGRSQFFRDALAEKLERDEGVMMLREKVVAPDRAGKGGPISYKKTKRQKILKSP